MSYAESLWLYTVLVFGIIVVPGMDMLFVVTNALTGGRQAGLAATAGMMLGGAVHTLFGAVGIAIVLQYAPSLFTVMLFAGAAYMAWIGITLLKSSITVGGVDTKWRRSSWTAFRQGLVTCLINPKAYLFVISVFPQFIKPQYGPLWQQALAIGMITVLMQLAIYGSLALAAGQSRDFLTTRPHATILIGKAAGVLFIAVAVLTAWHGWDVARWRGSSELQLSGMDRSNADMPLPANLSEVRQELTFPSSPANVAFGQVAARLLSESTLRRPPCFQPADASGKR